MAYFWVMEHPAGLRATTIVPVLAVDQWMNVQEWALLPYASLWPYVCLASALMAQKSELLAYTLRTTVLCGVGLLIFWLFPTAVPDFGVNWQAYPALEFLKSKDGGANALPSLHVGFAMFTLVMLDAQLRICRAPNWVRVVSVFWALLIVYSTMATRQHVFLDVAAGAILGLLVCIPLSFPRRQTPIPRVAANDLL